MRAIGILGRERPPGDSEAPGTGTTTLALGYRRPVERAVARDKRRSSARVTSPPSARAYVTTDFNEGH
jgi:hypothetical protein